MMMNGLIGSAGMKPTSQLADSAPATQFDKDIFGKWDLILRNV